MVELKDIAKKIEDILNTNSLGKTFRIFSDSGELAKRNKHENEYRNGLLEIVSSTTSNLSGLEFISSSVNLTLYANEEVRGKNSDGNSIEIIELRQILGDFLDSYNFKTFAEEFGEVTYSTTYVIGATTTLPKGSLGYINDCVPLITNIGLTFFENGVNSNEWIIEIDGEEVGYTNAVISRTKTAENQPLAESKSTKSVMQTNGFGLDLVVPQISNSLGNAIENEILTGKEYAHMLYIKGKNTEQNYICVFGNLQASLIKNSNVGFNVPLVEGVPDLLNYKENVWLELEVEVTVSLFDILKIYNNYDDKICISWGDGTSSYSSDEIIEHTYKNEGVYRVLIFNSNAVDEAWAESFIPPILSINDFTYRIDDGKLTIKTIKDTAPNEFKIASSYEINGETYPVKKFGYQYDQINANTTRIYLYEGIDELAGVFYNSGLNNSLEEFVIPEGVTVIPISFFEGCKKLKTINIPDSIISIGSNAFQDSNIENVIFGEDSQLTTIGGFSSCLNLKTINIPSSVTSIKEYAFSGSGLIEFPIIPSGVELIEPYTFNWCLGLSSVNIPSNVKRISNYAFRLCSNLENVTLNNGLEELDDYVFRSCSNLQSITIPASVIKIGSQIFNDCGNLTTINLLPTTPPTFTGLYKNLGASNLTRINVPSASLTAYQNASGWSRYAGIMVGV